MTKAPDRIWAWSEKDEGDPAVRKFWISNPEKCTGDETEYLSRAHCDALVASARKEALKEAVALVDKTAGQRRYVLKDAILALMEKDDG